MASTSLFSRRVRSVQCAHAVNNHHPPLDSAYLFRRIGEFSDRAYLGTWSSVRAKQSANDKRDD